MPSVFTDELAAYNLVVPATSDWTIASASLPNGDPAAYGDGSITPPYNVNGNAFDFTNGTAWTIEAWVYVSNAAADRMILVNMKAASGAANEIHWRFFISSSEVAWFTINNTGSGSYMQVSSSALSTGWHHIVVVKGTGASLKLYIDNAEVSSTTSTSGTAVTPTGSYYLYLGSYGNGDYDWDSTIKVGHLAIYNAALSTGQIASHYNTMLQL